MTTSLVIGQLWRANSDFGLTHGVCVLCSSLLLHINRLCVRFVVLLAIWSPPSVCVVYSLCAISGSVRFQLHGCKGGFKVVSPDYVACVRVCGTVIMLIDNFNLQKIQT